MGVRSRDADTPEVPVWQLGTGTHRVQQNTLPSREGGESWGWGSSKSQTEGEGHSDTSCHLPVTCNRCYEVTKVWVLNGKEGL